MSETPLLSELAKRAVSVLAALAMERPSPEVEQALEAARSVVRGADRIERETRHREVLLDVAAQLGSTLDVDRLLELVVERMVQVLNAERGLFAVFDSDGTVERAVCHNLKWDGPGSRLPVSQGLIDQVVRDVRPAIVRDVDQDVLYRSRHSVAAFGLRAMICVPVNSEGRVAGVLYADSRGLLDTVFEEELELLVALAGLVGIALANARLYQEQRFRAQLLATMVHEFRTPLSIIDSNAELVVAGLVTEIDDAREINRDVLGSVRRMSSLVDDTLELARMDAGAKSPAPVLLDVAAAIERQLNLMQLLAQSAAIKLSVEPSGEALVVETIPERFILILNNLLHNALKNSPPSGVVRVTIRRSAEAGPKDALARPQDDAAYLFRNLFPLSPQAGAGFAEITVHNQGSPIPAELLPRLFLAYSRGDSPARVRSTGLGLSIVDQCVRHLGGAVWARSDAESGTSFSFTLPIRLKDTVYPS